ncbi:MAG: amidohydrolase family protein, partial [Candidatus Thorarchaeota archaeon]
MTSKKGRLILSSGNIFNSISGKIEENKTIAINGNIISWVGDEGSFEKETNDKIIDVKGKTILPGLIECHVHLDATGTPQTERELIRTKTAMWPYIGLNNAQKHLASGFTCVRDCGSYPDWAPSLRRIFEQGLLAGPRLVVSDRFLGQFGNQEFVGPDMYIDYYRQYHETQSGVDGMIHSVRERK